MKNKILLIFILSSFLSCEKHPFKKFKEIESDEQFEISTFSKILSTGSNAHAFEVFELPDSSLLINNNYGNPRLVKIDKLGNIIDSYTEPDSNLALSSVIVATNGDIIMAGRRHYGNIVPPIDPDAYTQASLVKLNSDFFEIDEILVEMGNTRYNDVLTLVQGYEGDFLFAGGFSSGDFQVLSNSTFYGVVDIDFNYAGVTDSLINLSCDSQLEITNKFRMYHVADNTFTVVSTGIFGPQVINTFSLNDFVYASINPIESNKDGNIILLGYKNEKGVLQIRNFEGSFIEEKMLPDEFTIYKDISATRDNGFILCGYTIEGELGGFDIKLLRLDENYNTVWTKNFGTPLNDYANSVIQTYDGGFFCIGNSTNDTNGNTDIYMIKTNDEPE